SDVCSSDLNLMRLISLKIVVGVALSLYAVALARGSDLQDVPSFAFGGIGAAGIMSKGESALRSILAGPDAVTQLEKMLPHATDARPPSILFRFGLRAVPSVR